MPTRATVIRTTTMTGDDAVTGARRDVAVIMCRGASRRFGAPKALACVGNDPRPLLRRVADCFTGRFAGGIIVITTGDLAASCRSTLEGVPDVIVVPGPGGGDTALTLALAWEHLAALVPPCTHVWAHPVDVPDVAARTLGQLAADSAALPERAGSLVLDRARTYGTSALAVYRAGALADLEEADEVSQDARVVEGQG